MADRSVSYEDLWLIYKQSDRFKEQIVHWLNLPKNLPNYTVKMQLEVLSGAPEEIIKAHRRFLLPEAQEKLGLKTKQAARKEFGFTW